ncbi:STAS-like domain-containing protein [Patescibacteria group bacterium]|nr:STAS-like domain-containing protein [Patescibacteria group bacterium]MBU0964202.1 STAS-like domain-containing protein [Patescibacteria group bacterium]
MIIELKKFGTTLTSREEGREALAAFQPSLNNIPDGEPVEIIFTGVNTFSPSWGDEFLAPLIKQFGDRLIFVDTKNLSVIATLDMLEKIHDIRFIKKEKVT